MPRILIIYTSIDGQSARIAERIAARLRAASHTVTLRRAQAVEVLWEAATHDAVIVGGNIRYGHHLPALEEVVRERRGELEARPTAFFSVCLSAGGPGARPDAVRRYQQTFFQRTGWKPGRTTSFGGALLYTRYTAFTRFMIRLIMTITGGDIDTSRDYEYTDWEAVEAFADDFAADVAAARRAPLATAA